MLMFGDGKTFGSCHISRETVHFTVHFSDGCQS